MLHKAVDESDSLTNGCGHKVRSTNNSRAMSAHPVKLAKFVFPEADGPGDQHLLNQIRDHGWSVMEIPGEPGEVPPFAFTIGLYLRALAPEILIMGIDGQVAADVLNAVGDYIMSGKKLVLNHRHSDILKQGDLLFRQIDFRHYREHFGMAIWFYSQLPQAFPALQCFWSDKNGLFPHEPKCRKQVVELQPDLSK